MTEPAARAPLATGGSAEADQLRPATLHIGKLASRCPGQHERGLSFGFSDRSKTLAKLEENHHEAGGGSMSEFIRSGLIILMGMTVMVAGILVIFYG